MQAGPEEPEETRRGDDEELVEGVVLAAAIEPPGELAREGHSLVLLRVDLWLHRGPAVSAAHSVDVRARAPRHRAHRLAAAIAAVTRSLTFARLAACAKIATSWYGTAQRSGAEDAGAARVGGDDQIFFRDGITKDRAKHEGSHALRARHARGGMRVATAPSAGSRRELAVRGERLDARVLEARAKSS